MISGRYFQSITAKTLWFFTLMVLSVSALALLSSSYHNRTLVRDLENRQNRYITERIAREHLEEVQKEVLYLQLHAKAVQHALARALVMHDDTGVREILTDLLQHRTITEITLLDPHSRAPTLQAVRENGKIRYLGREFLTQSHRGSATIHLPLSYEGKNPGTLLIHYNTEYLLRQTQTKREQEIGRLKSLTSDLERKLNNHFHFQMIGFLIFSLLIILGFGYLIHRHVRLPLRILQDNLQIFFDFFRHGTGELKLQPIPGNDEFSRISRGINDNIQRVIDLHREVRNSREEILMVIGSIAEKHSKETGQHVRRVALYSEVLAKHCGLAKHEVEMLRDASTLHDLGKIAIPDMILNKRGELSPREYEIIKSHTVYGYNMLKDSSLPLLQTAALIAYEHHERYDGSGYPRGIHGEEIHLYGRIVGLADVFDALSSERIYKDSWSDEEIFDYFRRERGGHFDPKLIDIFFEHLDEFLRIRKQFEDLKSAA